MMAVRRAIGIVLAAGAVVVAASCSSTTGPSGAPGAVDDDASTPPVGADADPGPDADADADPVATSSTTSTSTSTTEPDPLPTIELAGVDAVGGYAGTQGLTGGSDGEIVVVTSAADAGPGTYRDALSQGDRHIVFDPSLDGVTIELQRDVIVDGSNVTLDGSGVDVIVTNYATKFTGTNIIVAGLTFADVDATDDEDAVTFLDADETQVVGLYGNTFSHASDGLVDFIWNRGHDVYATVCDNRFERHDKAMLVHSGRSGREGGVYHLTLCRNIWSDVYQRTPFTRDALVHQYNSVVERYGKADGSGGGSKAGVAELASQHRLENNVATPRRRGEETFDGTEVSTPRSEWAGPHLGEDGAVRISGTRAETVDDVTATEIERHRDDVFSPDYDYRLAPATAAMRGAVATTAGSCTPAPENAVVPCAPLLLLVAGDAVTIRLDDPSDVTSVSFVVSEDRIDAVDLGGGVWQATFAGGPSEPQPLDVTVTVADGRSVTETVAVVSLVG